MLFNVVASSVLCKCGGNPECQQLDHSVHRWPDVLLEPGYALPATGEYCYRTSFHSFPQPKPFCSRLWIDKHIYELLHSSNLLREMILKLYHLYQSCAICAQIREKAYNLAK